MKASVDPGKCEGHARCYTLAPEVFQLDEQGHAFVAVDEVGDELIAKVRRAAVNCPEHAITLVE